MVALIFLGAFSYVIVGKDADELTLEFVVT
jgi:hypothetical protein